MAINPTQASKHRKGARNRAMLEQHRSGLSFTDLARLHDLSSSRIRILVVQETARTKREVELVLADSLPIQPNPLHLSAETRRMVAEAVRRDDFTRADVVAAGSATLLRIHGMTGPHWYEVKAWLAR
jgi:hypothetical protein